MEGAKKKKRSTREKVIDAVDRVKMGQDNDKIMRATGVSYSTVQGIRNSIAKGEDPYLRTEAERILAKRQTVPTTKRQPDPFVAFCITLLVVATLAYGVHQAFQ